MLVDGGTAGPAEALAAALQVNGRARIVGDKTAGRGTVHGMRPLGARGEKGAVRLATARIKAPDGKPIEGSGIAPDLPVKQTPPDTGCRSVDIHSAAEAGDRCRRRTLAEDAQLQRAIGLLSGLIAGTAHPEPAAKVPEPADHGSR